MNASSSDELLNKALQGDAESLGILLQRYRPYLRVIAQRGLDTGIQPRVDPSDVVQQTCLEAHRDLTSFRGDNEARLVAWLRKILQNNVAQAIQKHILVQKRAVGKERSLNDARHGAKPLVEKIPAAQSSPSQKAMRGESAIELAVAMEDLPEDQYHAVRLRYLEGMSLAQIADEMQRSNVAVAGLLKRGLRRLRKRLVEPDSVEPDQET